MSDIERAWVWERNDGVVGAMLSEPSPEMLAANHMRWTEMAPASQLEGAVDLLRLALPYVAASARGHHDHSDVDAALHDRMQAVIEGQ